jgi:site-specific recombinase XerD
MNYNLDNSLLFFSMSYEFLNIYLPKQCGKSQCTVHNYKDSLSLFRRYLLDEHNISIGKFSFVDCTRDIVMMFLDHITNLGCANSTRNQRLASIKSYINFASEKDVSLQSIAININKIKQAKQVEPLRQSMSEEGVSAILSQPDITSLKGIRDRTILVVMYDSAVRVSELLDLRIGNITLDGDNSHIRILGKGSKERVVPICDNVSAYLHQYFQKYRNKIDLNTDLVFFTVIKDKPCKMSVRNVQLLLQQYADKARLQCPDIPINVHPHMFRRTRATLMYQSGVALPLVSRILGHASMNTTKIYATPSINMIKEAMIPARQFSTADEQPIWGCEDDVIKKCGLR